MKYGIKANGVDGSWSKQFNDLGAVQRFVRGHFQYYDGPETFHSDYVRFFCRGFVLADILKIDEHREVAGWLALPFVAPRVSFKAAEGEKVNIHFVSEGEKLGWISQVQGGGWRADWYKQEEGLRSFMERQHLDWLKKHVTRRVQCAALSCGAAVAQKILSMLTATWQGIAADYLNTCPKNEVKGTVLQEVVPDYIGTLGQKDEPVAEWKALSRSEQTFLLGLAFPRSEWFGI